MSFKEKYSYVLVTAARNEVQYIELCIKAVLSQSILPSKWVIVSDCSTDGTEIIIHKYAKDYKFIQLLRKEPNHEIKGFASKVFALHMGVELLKGIDYCVIGHLDADITIGNKYYEIMLNKFENNPKLGIIGGYIFEEKEGEFRSRNTNSTWSVAGGIQLFRRKCYQDIGGLKPMPLGGEDWRAEIEARMHGWEVIAFPEIPAFHHKPSVSKRGIIKEAIRGGAMDYVMGTHPLFEFFKCVRRVKKKPYFVFAIIQFYGFLRPYLMGQHRHVSEDTMAFVRNDQLSRLREILFLFFRNYK